MRPEVEKWMREHHPTAVLFTQALTGDFAIEENGQLLTNWHAKSSEAWKEAYERSMARLALGQRAPHVPSHREASNTHNSAAQVPARDAGFNNLQPVFVLLRTDPESLGNFASKSYFTGPQGLELAKLQHKHAFASNPNIEVAVFWR